MSSISIESSRDGGVAGPVTIFVCITCRKAEDPMDFPRPGATLAARAAEAAEGTGFTVRRVRCLANCTRALSAALRRHHDWSYVFGGLGPANDRSALVRGRRVHAAP